MGPAPANPTTGLHCLAMRWGSNSTLDTLQVTATVGFPALQFNTVTEQFVATRKMPERVTHNLPNFSQSTLQQTNMLLFAELGIP